jgi:hypothetical protein
MQARLLSQYDFPVSSDAAPSTQPPSAPESGATTPAEALSAPVPETTTEAPSESVNEPTTAQSPAEPVSEAAADEPSPSELVNGACTPPPSPPDPGQMKELRTLYLGERDLRRKLRTIRRIRATFITVIVVGLVVLALWGVAVHGFAIWNTSLGYRGMNENLIFDVGHWVAWIAIAISVAGLLIMGLSKFGSVNPIKKDIDDKVANRNLKLNTVEEKTEDFLQRSRVDVAGYHEQARRLRWTNNIMQIVVILGSLLAATFAGLSNNAGARWAAVISGAFASFAASMISFFKFRERSFGLEQAGSEIDSELNSYDLNAGRFRRLKAEERQPELVEAIERVRSDLQQREAALGTDTK